MVTVTNKNRYGIDWAELQLQTGYEEIYIVHPKFPLHKLFVNDKGKLTLEEVGPSKLAPWWESLASQALQYLGW
jgi:hypothetical protein